MPRTARLDIPGLLQHVMVRGIEKRDIFRDDQDRHSFLARLAVLLAETEARCYAWALMPNHAHLLLMPTSSTLAHLMRRLLTGYVVTFNRRHNRAGHLFQNRYKSIVCEAESYLLELVRYIHLNPLRSGLVKDFGELANYPWCGHSVLLGQRQMPGQRVEEILTRFGREPSVAREKYQEFVADGASLGHREDLRTVRPALNQGAAETSSRGTGSDERILGSSEFVDALRKNDALAEGLGDSWSLADIIVRVAKVFQLAPEALRQPGKARGLAKARGLVCYLAVLEMGYRGIDVGRELRLGSAGVSRALRRGELLMREDPGVRLAVDLKLGK